MKRTLFAYLTGTLLLLFALMLSSCASTPRKLYDARPAHTSPAELKQYANVTITSIDGISDGNLSHVMLLPGRHTVTVEFFRDTYRIREYQYSHWNINYRSAEPVSIEFDAKPGTAYRISGINISDTRCRIEISESGLIRDTVIASETGPIKEEYVKTDLNDAYSDHADYLWYEYYTFDTW